MKVRHPKHRGPSSIRRGKNSKAVIKRSVGSRRPLSVISSQGSRRVKGDRSYPLVLVEWEDSQTPLPAWQWVDEYSLPDIVRCRSVGFLIAKTKSALALAPNLGDLEQERDQACGIICIPTSAVITISRLTPAAENSDT